MCESGQAAASSEPDGARQGDHGDGGKGQGSRGRQGHQRDQSTEWQQASSESQGAKAKARVVGTSPVRQASSLALLALEGKNPPLGGPGTNLRPGRGLRAPKTHGHPTCTPVRTLTCLRHIQVSLFFRRVQYNVQLTRPPLTELNQCAFTSASY